MDAINITGPVCTTSYGYVVQNIVKQFIKNGWKVCVRPIGPMEEDFEAGYSTYLDKVQSEVIEGAPHLIIWHQFELHKYCIEGFYNVGFPIFELDSFDEREVQSMSACNELIVCSKWAQEIVSRYLNMPISVAPLGVDPEVFFPIKNTEPTSLVKYISIGKWEVRKNQIGIAKAFAEAFGSKPDVSLTFVCSNEFIGEDNTKWADLIKRIVGDSAYILPFRLKSHKDINILLNQHDVGIFPSRAEGWGLESNEMLELGKLAIMTRYSGHTEYMDSYSNVLSIPINEIEPAFDGRWFFYQGNWAQFGEPEFKNLVSALHQSYQLIKNGLTQASETAKIFTWERSVRCIEGVLKGKAINSNVHNVG